MRIVALVAGALLTACGPADDAVGTPVSEVRASKAPQPLQSGYDFLQADTQALQDDDFANPGFLWVDRGEALFSEGETACASCHEAGTLAGAATRYPGVDDASGALVNLEGRINLCRTRHQTAPALAYESDGLLALTAYVAHQSRGQAMSVAVDGPARRHVEAGEAYFFTRRGQFNLSCAQCHNDHAGKRLRGDTISQGHGNGFPAYRFEWQGMGSLHRRLQDCDTGVRAEPLALGSETYTQLELYLASRAEGLPIETPAVRR